MTGNFTIVNGQVYTPGLAIIDAPQPYTPLGGDTLQVAIEVSGNGHLPWPPSSSSNPPSALETITLFLTSYDKSRNFTISNGTAPGNQSTAYVVPVLDLEPSSTVKHVNWMWPGCFVGEGGGSGDSARGDYNISMHQSFRWNETEYYTVFDLPISVSNGIEETRDRVDCALLENEMLRRDVVAESSDTLPGQPWVGNGTSGNVGTGSGTRLHTGVGRWVLLGLIMAFFNGV